MKAKENELVLLTRPTQRIDHDNTNLLDEEVKHGTAENYALSLNHLVVTCFPEALQKSVAGQISLTLAHEIAFLCNRLDKILRCSDATLATFGSKFIKHELVPSLPRVVERFVHWKEGGMTRLLTLVKALNIMKRIERFVEMPLPGFLAASRLFLQHEFPYEIQVKAAFAIVQFLQDGAWPKSSELLGEPLAMEECDLLLEILCKSATDSNGGWEQESMVSLLQLTRLDFIRPKMAKQACVAGAIRRNLLHHRKTIRKGAVNIIITLLKGYKKDVTKMPFPSDTNLGVLTSGLVQAALQEEQRKMLLALLKAMYKLFRLTVLRPQQALDVRKTFFVLSQSEHADAAVFAGCLYIQTSIKAIQDAQVLSNIVDLATSRHEEIRATAWSFLQDVCFWNPRTDTSLFQETSLVQQMTRILQKGSHHGDCWIVLQICQLAVFDKKNHAFFLQDSDFMMALIRCSTTNSNINSNSAVAMEILLDLLASCCCQEEQAPLLTTAFGHILPWMKEQAKLTSNVELQERLVTKISHLLQLLDESLPLSSS